MKWQFLNCVCNIPIENSYIKFDSNKTTIHSLQISEMYKITYLYTKSFIAYPNIITTFLTTAIFKSFVKENYDYKRTCAYVHDHST
jgi:hypothetical protein